MRLKSKRSRYLQGGEMFKDFFGNWKKMVIASVVLLIASGVLFAATRYLIPTAPVTAATLQAQHCAKQGQVWSEELHTCVVAPTPTPESSFAFTTNPWTSSPVSFGQKGTQTLFRWENGALGREVSWRIIALEVIAFDVTGTMDKIGWETLRIYDLATDSIIPGQWMISHSDRSTYVVFVAASDQIVGENTIKTYELRGDLYEPTTLLVNVLWVHVK
jgi:hypothetical protein